MIFDLIVVAIFFIEVKSGFADGFIKSLLKTVGYISGAIGGLYLALQYDHSAWVIFAIFFGAGVGTWVGSMLAKALKLTVLRGPLAWINSWTGALLHGLKVVVLAYVVGTILLWAPWSTGQNAIAESKVYLKLNTYAPSILENLQAEIGKRFEKF